MTKNTNGTTQQRFGVRCIEFGEQGYAVFQADEKRPPEPDMLPGLLSKAFTSWVKQRPEITVKTTLPIVKDGQTVAIHVWYDEK